MTNPKMIDSILKTQDFAFSNKIAEELNFHNDIVPPSKEERKPPNIITETKSRFVTGEIQEDVGGVIPYCSITF